jgi:CRISPR/Cas system-associated exonuclease Cas4 (RecB family)
MKRQIDYSKIYSASKLSAFEECPKFYHFNYLDPIYTKMKGELKKQPQNIWSFQTLGKAVHNAITLFYHTEVGERNFEALKKYLTQTWQSEVMWNKKMPLGKWGGFASLDEERDFYRQALEMLKNFLRVGEIEPSIEYLPTSDFTHSIDDYLNLVTPLYDDLNISGKFDLITKNEDGSLNIIDFKTGKKEDEKPFQLKFYKLLAQLKFEKPVKRASFFFLKTGNIKDFEIEEDEGLIKEEVLDKIKKITQTEEFVTRPSPLCRFCLFKDFCPEKTKVKEMTKKPEEEYPDDLPF